MLQIQHIRFDRRLAGIATFSPASWLRRSVLCQLIIIPIGWFRVDIHPILTPRYPTEALNTPLDSLAMRD